MIAVIFSSQRTDADAVGYAAAADEMDALARTQPGFVAVESARGADGFGITVSYWESEEAAKAWRAHPRHSEIREQGRAGWYESYAVHVAEVTRTYNWTKEA